MSRLSNHDAHAHGRIRVAPSLVILLLLLKRVKLEAVILKRGIASPCIWAHGRAPQEHRGRIVQLDFLVEKRIAETKAPIPAWEGQRRHNRCLCRRARPVTKIAGNPFHLPRVRDALQLLGKLGERARSHKGPASVDAAAINAPERAAQLKTELKLLRECQATKYLGEGELRGTNEAAIDDASPSNDWIQATSRKRSRRLVANDTSEPALAVLTPNKKVSRLIGINHTHPVQELDGSHVRWCHRKRGPSGWPGIII